MPSTPVIVVFDIGKTNKKLFLFDERYKIVHEHSSPFPEIKDDDGFPCDDIHAITAWINASLEDLAHSNDFDIKAINFSSYGASFVHVDGSGKPALPLYNYLKPFPETLKKRFFDTYGGEKKVSRETASPVLDSLNSGLQLYRLKYERNLTGMPGVSLHLPQYLSYLVTGKYCSDLTSIGCHTMLWNFEQNAYHEWVHAENILNRLAPVFPSDGVMQSRWKNIKAGGGLHDSSSALIPYLAHFHEPFVLISTGTWSISMNPFNNVPLTDDELERDCLSFMTFRGAAVKASRLFAGNAHEEEIRRLASHFSKPLNTFQSVAYDGNICEMLKARLPQDGQVAFVPGSILFGKRDLNVFDSYEQAYHQLLMDIVHQQTLSTRLVMKGTGVKKIFVDGGFGKNPVYMKLLSAAFPETEVYASSVPQASAIGAAVAIHAHWNSQPVPDDLIALKRF